MNEKASWLQLEDVYAEIHRVLKPGALFASYEWVATAKFDAGNPDHVRIMDEINYGNGLPVRANAPTLNAVLVVSLAFNSEICRRNHQYLTLLTALVAPALLY